MIINLCNDQIVIIIFYMYIISIIYIYVWSRGGIHDVLLIQVLLLKLYELQCDSCMNKQSNTWAK